MVLRVAGALALETCAWTFNRFNLGEAHPTLVGANQWYPDDELSELNRRCKGELAALGLIDRGGDRLTNLGEDVFHVLLHAEVEYYTYLHVNGNPATLRAAASGTDALLIVNLDGLVDIEGIDRDYMGTSLERALPAMPPARIHGLTADVELIKKLLAGERMVGGHQIADAKRIAQWLDLEQTNAGEMHVSVRHSYDAKPIKSADPPPSWIDADGGRALLHMKDGWVTLTPAAPGAVAAKFAELERSLQRR